MIEAETINDLPPELQEKIRSDTLRLLVQRLYDQDQASDETLMTVFGFNRQTLQQIYDAMYVQTVQSRGPLSGMGGPY